MRESRNRYGNNIYQVWYASDPAIEQPVFAAVTAEVFSASRWRLSFPRARHVFEKAKIAGQIAGFTCCTPAHGHCLAL